MTVTLYYLGVCVSGKWGGGGSSSIFRRRRVWLKLSHSIHLKAKSEKHVHNMTTIFYLYDCISFNWPPLIQPTISTPYTGCKLISHIKENKGMGAMMLFLCPFNSQGHTYIGPLIEFHRWGSFSTASRRHFRS